MTSSMQEMIGWAVKIWRAESNAHLRVALSNSWGVVCSSRHLGSLFWCKWLVTLYTPWSWYNIVKQQLVVPPPCTPGDMCCTMSISVSGVTKASNLSSIGLVASNPLGKLFSLQSLAMFVNNRRTSVLSANTFMIYTLLYTMYLGNYHARNTRLNRNLYNMNYFPDKLLLLISICDVFGPVSIHVNFTKCWHDMWLMALYVL